MILSIIVAASTNNAIGLNNQLLWHLPNDMKFFKNTTWAMPIIMGRKTFESLSCKPLLGRLNIIVTRQTDWKAEKCQIVHSLSEAISLSKSLGYKEAFIIGGGEIYKESFALVHKIYMTRVDVALDGDSFFPVIDPTVWHLHSTESFMPDNKHAYEYHFQLWERNKVN